MKDIAPYLRRRQTLLRQMDGGIAVIPTASQAVRSGDTHYPYRFDNYFHYLTGFTEPGAVLVLIAGDEPKSVLFCRDKNIEHEIWDGFRHGPEGARLAFGFDEAYSISRLDELMPQLLANQPRLYFALGCNAQWDKQITGWLNAVRGQARTGVTAPGEIIDVRDFLDEMRLFKSKDELATMRRAAEISAAAHRRAMRATRPGMMEYEIEAELLHEFRKSGAQAPAYTSIVAGGANACVLHYVSNDAPLRDGDLLLIDAGCELDGYASDITRTFPVNGRFSAVQKDIYEIVLAAQAAAIVVARPGKCWNDQHMAALRVIARGLIDLKLCKGSVNGVLESGDYKRYYMHRTGHWLGMDVHDVGAYKQNSDWRALRVGMTFTVEPGCYIRPAADVPEHFWNIGIRIEDDVVVTANGCEIITAAAPKSVGEIEQWMAQ
ncbi:MAG: Xaa-Pro aminopeptidase [Methylobacillus sp.]|jgi:Xaa-Pro aminopeptidase|nr:Xaa-Pro aminopeptidase [Methylobacillus sp.]